MLTYHRLLTEILQFGEEHEDRTGVGTLSIFGYQWRHYMPNGFPLLTTKRLPMRWIFEEMRWFLSGSTYEPDLRATGVDIWQEWATKEKCAEFKRPEGELGPIYGTTMRKFPIGPALTSTGWYMAPDAHPYSDQIATLLEELRTQPDSRRLIVSNWHPYWSRRVTVPACHTLWQVKTHAQRPGMSSREISLHLYMRSADVFLGVPFNIASYALLLCLIANTVDMRPRELIVSYGDVHIYKNHLDQVREQLSRTPNPLPKLHIRNKRNKLEDYVWDDIDLQDYRPHPSISAPVAI